MTRSRYAQSLMYLVCTKYPKYAMRSFIFFRHNIHNSVLNLPHAWKVGPNKNLLNKLRQNNSMFVLLFPFFNFKFVMGYPQASNNNQNRFKYSINASGRGVLQRLTRWPVIRKSCTCFSICQIKLIKTPIEVRAYLVRGTNPDRGTYLERESVPTWLQNLICCLSMRDFFANIMQFWLKRKCTFLEFQCYTYFGC